MAKKDLQKWLEEHEAPESCGVYQFFDELSDVIYVGKSVNLRRRMQQYLASSRKKKLRKSRSIIKDAVRVEFEICADGTRALLRENELIRALQPRFNTAGAFSFLYPVIAARYSERRLALVRTTMPEAYAGFQLFGAFRDRQLVKEMFESIEYLLSFVGHQEPATRLKDIPKADFTRRSAFREVREDYWPLIQSFFSGKDDGLLRVLCDHLLSLPTAVANAGEVESSLKTLREFFKCEARKLFEACRNIGRSETYIDQSQRDALFIQANS